MNPKKKVGFVIVFSNLFLLLIKGIVWWYSGSIAVQSEAFNSLVDFVYSLIIISGFLLSRREKTSEYPEGLIRLEPLVSLFVSGAIVLTGGFIMYNGVQRLLFDNIVTERTSLAIGVLIAGSIIKLGLYKYISEKADTHNSLSCCDGCRYTQRHPDSVHRINWSGWLSLWNTRLRSNLSHYSFRIYCILWR